ncbi:MAG: hypothetical protein DRP47_00705 [Candidatus Zixiibacteriota bacterium]|nr:MAG: hypothetical protein DRP47_00705 [candidate division Zixibacteria bacterium]
MSTRAKELLVVGIVLLFCIIAYLGKVYGWVDTVVFSPMVSMIVVGIIILGLVFVLIRTLQGRLINRQVVFLFVGIAVIMPFFMSITQKIRTSPEVQQLYDAVAELPKGSKVLVSFDYDPPSAPELQPMAEAFLYYCLSNDLKVIIMGLWPQGAQQANLALEAIMKNEKLAAKGLEYGKDYVNLGYQAGNEFVIQRMGADFSSMFRTDYSGRHYEELELVKNVKNFSNIDYSFNLSAGYPGTQEWVQVAVDRYGLKMGCGNTAVQAPMMYTYLNAGQLVGLLGGMNGAAEFEQLVKYPGKGTKFMLSQSFAHMIVIAFIIIGNVAFFRSGRGKKL